MSINQEEIRNKLFELADSKYKEFHSGLCPNTNNIIGVRVPVLRNYAKELAKQDFREYLKNARDDYYEEVMLQGMVIGLAKIDIEEFFSYLKMFIPKIDNWAVCDVCCAGFKITTNHMEQVWEFLHEYLKSDNEFEIRFAVVMLLNYYIKDEYIDKVLSEIDKIKHSGYYVQMAIAWLVSIAYIKFPEKTMKYLKNNTLNNFTYNKALQKIVESSRVSDSDKKIIRSMKA